MAEASFQMLCLDSRGDQMTGVLRVHPDGGDWSDRSPYTWSCTLRLKPPVAEIMGVIRAPTREERRALTEFLISKNITEAHYEIGGRQIVRRRKL